MKLSLRKSTALCAAASPDSSAGLRKIFFTDHHGTQQPTSESPTSPRYAVHKMSGSCYSRRGNFRGREPPQHHVPPGFPADYISQFSNNLSMAPAPTTANESAPASYGPHPSFIQVAKPFVFQQQLQGQLVAIGTNPTREDTFRLQGVQWINDVRTALQL
jgi:hypothetical protein